MKEKYIAHISEDKSREQSVEEHLLGTAKLASSFASEFGAEGAAYRCGDLHDIGKYPDKFQRRIRGSGGKVDHSTAGAQVAWLDCKDPVSAFCIAGHHGGLPDMGSMSDCAQEATLRAKLKRKPGIDIEDYTPFKTLIKIPPCEHPKTLIATPEDCAFYIRMLFSCLVDADFLDTERFMTDGEKKRGEYQSLSCLWDKLLANIEEKRWLEGKDGINIKRSQILRALIAEGNLDKGLFSLSVPTGGGKTVASMAFALRHALLHGMRRVIYVIPYCSIIEQTQDVFAGIFGSENVVAHFSNVDYGDNENMPEDQRRLATENWDAPIILTTAVQFFESLYSNRTSRCRKLHNIANSVIVFDEAQMLPPPCLLPCVHAITQLVKNYSCSAILCTATRPSLDRLFARQLPDAEIKELCPEPAAMYESFRRVRYAHLDTLSDEALAQRLGHEKQVLCIVNNRKQAQALYAALKGEGTYHLSTTMYPAHRRAVLSEIRARLNKGLPCRTVSTSLAEAGVDVDFPTVYRALAGLDSILQAGGRCNREGKRDPQSSMVYYFDTEAKLPKGMEQNAAAMKWVLRSFKDIASPDAVEAYFEFLFYTLKGEEELDKAHIVKELASGSYAFASVAKRFHIIEENTYTIYIPRDEGVELVNRLCGQEHLSRALMRQLGRYAVNVYSSYYQRLLAQGAVKVVAENAAVLTDVTLYDENTGLALELAEGREYIL